MKELLSYDFRGGDLNVYTHKVTSVGRLYIHLVGGVKVNRNTLVSVRKAGATSQYYASRADLDRRIARQEQWAAFREQIYNVYSIPPQHVIDRAYELLGKLATKEESPDV